RGLVVEQARAAGAGAGYDANGLDGSSFSFWVSPRPGIEVEAVEAALLAEIDRLLEEGVEAGEVEKAKQRLIDQVVYANDSAGSSAQIIGRALATGSSVEDVEDWPNRVRAVTPEAVEAAARAVLDPARSTTAVLRSAPTT
ncbi:MAG: insulinase family protein, partial [Tistlia sp.]